MERGTYTIQYKIINILDVRYCGKAAYMEKAHVAAGGPFFGVRRRGVFTQLCLSPPPPNFWAFLHSSARRRLKNWISVGDRITGSPGFYKVHHNKYFRCEIMWNGFIKYNRINVLNLW